MSLFRRQCRAPSWSCGLLSNQLDPWTHSYAQWTQTTWPIEHPTDCVISACWIKNKHRGYIAAPGDRLGEKTSHPPVPFIQLCLCCLSLIYSHLLSLWQTRSFNLINGVVFSNWRHVYVTFNNRIFAWVQIQDLKNWNATIFKNNCFSYNA